MTLNYAKRLRAVLTPDESKILRKLSSPRKIQDFLDTLPVNLELDGPTQMSPRRVLQTRRAHCLEGAVLAATALAYHGGRPLLLDFQAVYNDEDHVVALFQENGHWGAISKTNHPGLRYRDPIYRSMRDLAASYFHEYYCWDGRKSLRFYSRPFDLSRYAPETWATATEDLDWLAEALDSSPHAPLVPKGNLRKLRRASAFEIRASSVVEWPQEKPKTAAAR